MTERLSDERLESLESWARSIAAPVGLPEALAELRERRAAELCDWCQRGQTEMCVGVAVNACMGGPDDPK